MLKMVAKHIKEVSPKVGVSSNSNEGNSALRAAESTAKALGNDKTSFQSENKDTQEIQEAKDLVKDIYDDGFKKNGKAPSVEEVKNEVAKIMGDHSHDNVIENA